MVFIINMQKKNGDGIITMHIVSTSGAIGKTIQIIRESWEHMERGMSKCNVQSN